MLHRGKDIKLTRLALGDGQRHFFEGGTSLFDRFALALCDLRYFSKKEYFESFHFSRRVQRLVAQYPTGNPFTVVDVGAGHGLTGLFLVAYSNAKRVKDVILLDPFVPTRAHELFALFAEHVPHVKHRVQRVVCTFSEWVEAMESDPERANQRYLWTACHGCGQLSDAVLAVALRRREPFVLMPCCPNRRLDHWPRGYEPLPDVAIDSSTDIGIALDMMRAGQARAAQYRMLIRTIDEEITPFNRVLIGRPSEDKIKN
jgi:hypothetical protein